MREKLRLAILDAYGIDIDKYEFEFKNSLSAYTISIDDFFIRVTLNDGVKKETRLARMQWARDLKSFKNTICEPIPSKRGELLEEIRIGKWSLTMSMHRMAKGEVIDAENLRPMVFISAGDMLGTMHRMSMDSELSQADSEIPTPDLMYEEKLKRVRGFLSSELNQKIDFLISESQKVKRTKENYGICYGEFDLHNIVVDTNNIHLFDFDRSIYAHYLYDVASFVVSILSAGYQPERPAKEVVYNHFIPWFRIGYSINKPCNEHTFDELPLFMGLRGVWLLINLVEQYQTEENPFIKQQMDLVSGILTGKDIFAGIDIVRNVLFVKNKKNKK